MNVERLIVLVMAMIINVVNNMRTRSECREANSASNGNDNQCCE